MVQQDLLQIAIDRFGQEEWDKVISADEISKQKVDTYINYDSESKLLKLNCDKSQNDLQWVPTLDLDKTLEYTADWYKVYQLSPESTRKISEAQILDFSKINKHYLFNS